MNIYYTYNDICPTHIDYRYEYFAYTKFYHDQFM